MLLNGKRGLAGALALAVVCACVPAGCSGRKAKESAGAKAVDGKKVLLVHSYDVEYPWVKEITQGVKSAFKGRGVELEIVYMDTKRKTSEQSKTEAGERARTKVAAWKPDVVIAADDNAQQYFAKSYVGSALPIVFCGVNADPAKYGYPAKNVTGILERPDFNGAVKFVNSLRPLKKVAVISSDDPTSLAWMASTKKGPVDVTVAEWTLIGDMDTWKKTVKRLNGSVDAIGVFLYQTVKTQKGGAKRVEPKEVVAWTVKNVSIPTMGFIDFAIKDGLMAGVIESGTEQGRKAAEYALKILEGTPAASLPVVKGEIGVKMVNRNTAAKVLGVPLTPTQLKGVRVVSD